MRGLSLDCGGEGTEGRGEQGGELFGRESFAERRDTPALESVRQDKGVAGLAKWHRPG